MKVLLSFLFISILTSCSKHCIYNNFEQEADLETQKRIERTEVEFKKQISKQPYSYNDLESLINLSEITPKVLDYSCWNGKSYELNQNDIDSLKKWFERNKTYLSYDNENDYLKFMDSIKSKCKEKIIVLKLPNGKLRNSYNFQDTVWINSIRKSIKEKRNSKEKHSH